MNTPQEVTFQLEDYRQRVLAADKLRLAGDEEGARKLMPTREEIIQSIKAYRKLMTTKQTKRATSSEGKAKANKIKTMDNLADLFKS